MNDDKRRELYMFVSSILKDFVQNNKKVVSFSLKENELDKFCKEFVLFLKSGTWIFLKGEIGSGKTTLTKSLAQVLNCKDLSSPTFSILNKHELKESILGFDAVFHLDLYRINKDEELFYLGLEDELSFNPNSLVFLEWPNRVSKKFWPVFFKKTLCPMPKLFFEIEISYSRENTFRTYKISKLALF